MPVGNNRVGEVFLLFAAFFFVFLCSCLLIEGQKTMRLQGWEITSCIVLPRH